MLKDRSLREFPIFDGLLMLKSSPRFKVVLRERKAVNTDANQASFEVCQEMPCTRTMESFKSPGMPLGWKSSPGNGPENEFDTPSNDLKLVPMAILEDAKLRSEAPISPRMSLQGDDQDCTEVDEVHVLQKLDPPAKVLPATSPLTKMDTQPSSRIYNGNLPSKVIEHVSKVKGSHTTPIDLELRSVLKAKLEQIITKTYPSPANSTGQTCLTPNSGKPAPLDSPLEFCGDASPSPKSTTVSVEPTSIEALGHTNDTLKPDSDELDHDLSDILEALRKAGYTVKKEPMTALHNGPKGVPSTAFKETCPKCKKIIGRPCELRYSIELQ